MMMVVVAVFAVVDQVSQEIGEGWERGVEVTL